MQSGKACLVLQRELCFMASGSLKRYQIKASRMLIFGCLRACQCPYLPRSHALPSAQKQPSLQYSSPTQVVKAGSFGAWGGRRSVAPAIRKRRAHRTERPMCAYIPGHHGSLPGMRQWVCASSFVLCTMRRPVLMVAHLGDLHNQSRCVSFIPCRCGM